MSRVYFLRDKERLFSVCKDFFEEIYTKNKPLLIKIGFGNSDNKFALSPEDIRPVIEAAESLGLKPILIDTPVSPVAYHRATKETALGFKKLIFNIFYLFIFLIFSKLSVKKNQEKIIEERGFLKLAQSLISNRFGKKIKSKNINVEICRDFTEADNVLVLSHFKGHSCCGFGGTIKNLAMGMVSIETKTKQHFFAAPKIIGDCQGCGRCVDLCPGEAITLFDRKIKINQNKCFYCSICQIECPHKCLAPKKAIFDDLLAQVSVTVFKNLPKKSFFINFAENISKGCDCVPTTRLISGDAGIFFSDNPILIDKASVDYVNKINGRNLFFEENHKDPYLQINSALKYGGFGGEYDLINL